MTDVGPLQIAHRVPLERDHDHDARDDEDHEPAHYVAVVGRLRVTVNMSTLCIWRRGASLPHGRVDKPLRTDRGDRGDIRDVNNQWASTGRGETAAPALWIWVRYWYGLEVFSL